MQNFVPPNAEFKSRVAGKIKGNAFMHHLGLEITRIEPGLVEGILEVKPHHLQQFGRLHGGVVTALADISAGFAVYTLAPADLDVVTGEIKISYLRPGLGTQIKAVGTVLKPGKSVSFAESEIYSIQNGEEILIAKATTTMILIKLAQ